VPQPSAFTKATSYLPGEANWRTSNVGQPFSAIAPDTAGLGHSASQGPEHLAGAGLFSVQCAVLHKMCSSGK